MCCFSSCGDCANWYDVCYYSIDLTIPVSSKEVSSPKHETLVGYFSPMTSGFRADMKSRQSRNQDFSAICGLPLSYNETSLKICERGMIYCE